MSDKNIREQKKAQAKQLRLDGLTYAKIARELGISTMTAYAYVTGRKQDRSDLLDCGLTYGQFYARSIHHKNLHQHAKKRAAKKMVQFSITLDFVKKLLINMRCSVPGCGRDLIIGSGSVSKNSATLDEVIVGNGYTPENTALVCHECNRRKSDLTKKSIGQILEHINNHTPEIIQLKNRISELELAVEKKHSFVVNNKKRLKAGTYQLSCGKLYKVV